MLDYVPFDVLVVKDETNLVGKAIVALYALPIPAGPHGLWASSYAQRAESLLLNEHLRNSKDLRLWDCALVLRAYHEEAATDPDAKHSHVTNKGPCSSFDLTVLGNIHQCMQSCIQVWLSCSIPPETYIAHKHAAITAYLASPNCTVALSTAAACLICRKVRRHASLLLLHASAKPLHSIGIACPCLQCCFPTAITT